MMRLLLLCLPLSLVSGYIPSFQKPSSIALRTRVPIKQASTLRYARDWDEDDDDDLDDDDEEIDLGDQDWRTFRAKLVMSDNEESSTATTAPPPTVEDDFDGIGALFQDSILQDRLDSMTPLDPSQWAYESGKVIEQGAVILGGVEQEVGFGLRQQYFHKAAILVLDHGASFTKGIILNRPTDLTLEDDRNEGVKWRVWFGGDVQGLDSDSPDIVCLHSLRDPQVKDVSIPVMNDIQWTSFENAKRLVQTGVAKPTDFWVFTGYAGWGPNQLMEELERKSWYMVATDSQTLLKELARLSAGADPRDAGLDTWMLLMNMIGRKETAESSTGHFDDLMLKEWARQHLLSSSTTTESDAASAASFDFSLFPKRPKIAAGTLLRASAAERSPFLLRSQELHKSVVLILSEDERISVGAILNRPAARSLDIRIASSKTGATRTVTIPLRFGGNYQIKGGDSLLWLHWNPSLKQVGSPVGKDANGVYKCTVEDVMNSIGKGVASPEDFVVVSGLSAWAKHDGSEGLPGEVARGKFDIIPPKQAKAVWGALLDQTMLTDGNLSQSLEGANEVWVCGEETRKTKPSNGVLPMTGLGDGFDDEDDSVVYRSDVKVSKLSDDALRNWVSTFLLGIYDS